MHFSVLVKVPQDLLKQKLEETENQDQAIAEGIAHMLAPYQDNNLCSCPPEYMEFNNVEEECRKDYEEVAIVRLKHKETGKMICPFTTKELEENCPLNPEWVEARDKLAEEQNIDSQLAEMRMKSRSDFKGDKYDKSAFEEVKIPVKEEYDWDAYMREYRGYRFDEDQQAYGYWENPNSKWDWYRVGGFRFDPLPVKGGAYRTAAVAAVRDLDFERIDSEQEESIQAFLRRIEIYKQFVEEVKKPNLPYDKWESDPRWEDIQFEGIPLFEWDLGCVLGRWGVCDQYEVLEPSENEGERDKFLYYDLSGLTEETVREHSDEFAFDTWAVLDKDGWKEKGEMGWFDLSDATSESTKDFREGYIDKYLRNEDPETIVAIVDCHI